MAGFHPGPTIIQDYAGGALSFMLKCSDRWVETGEREEEPKKRNITAPTW